MCPQQSLRGGRTDLCSSSLSKCNCLGLTPSTTCTPWQQRWNTTGSGLPLMEQMRLSSMRPAEVGYAQMLSSWFHPHKKKHRRAFSKQEEQVLGTSTCACATYPSPTCFSFGFSFMLGGSKRNVSALRSCSKQKCTSASKAVMLRMVIFSQLLGWRNALYLSTRREKAVEETTALETHRGKHCVLAAGGPTGRP